jgi:hypothetical protein
MSLKALVVPATPPDIGSELTPDTFRRVGTPEVFIPTDFPTLKIENAEIKNISGELNGLPTIGGGSVALDDVTDVDATSPEDLSILQYDALNTKWVAVANTDFIDAVIDGGQAGSESDYVEAFDLDGGNA